MCFNLILLNIAVVAVLAYYDQPGLYYMILIGVNVLVGLFMFFTRDVNFASHKATSKGMFPNESVKESHNFAKADRPMNTFSDVDDNF